MFKQFLVFCSVILLSVSLVHAEEYIAGKHYEVLPQAVVTRDKSKIEVVEVFWFGCSHCYNFESMLQSWEKNLADDVDFHQMPAIWNSRMEVHAKAFYAAHALGKLEQLQPVIFKAMHVEKNKLEDKKEIEKLFVKYGVDANAFDKTFDSFGVNSQVQLAKSRGTSYRVQGTPEMIVNGKYRVSASLSGGQAGMLKVVEFLIGKEREMAK